MTHSTDAPNSDVGPDANAPGTGPDPFAQTNTGALGMFVFLASLTVLFAATMFIYFVLALTQEGRVLQLIDSGEIESIAEVPAIPSLPGLLWLGTLVILISSITMHIARTGIRSGSQLALRIGLLLTTLLGLLFLGIQSLAWSEWIEAARPVLEHPAYRFAAYGFVILSGLHAAHVIGGVIPLIVVLINSLKGRYTATHHRAVANVAVYWHFLDVVWVVMFLLLLIPVW